ncbi:hypothetical protein [Kocuria turfanensis]|uniref:Uncharacterized protein n=1 Tax=Kocuria turfanensis TaxID=388357 RepID=A0A512IG52_9MICC|nr:hypothetical protein [Kocuria turfanensis]GEO96682.1 hypothetical protein KTU01_28050 [Kocuria turfanensis]
MRPALRTGVRLFVCTTPAAVAVLAVATDTPAVMVLIAVPGAVVAGVLLGERRRPAAPVGAAGAVPAPPARPDTYPALLPDPEAPIFDDVTLNRIQARSLRRTLAGTGLTPHRLWLRYLDHGGIVGDLELEAYLHEILHLPAVERDRLMLTATTLLDARCPPFLPRTNDLLGIDRAQDHPADRQN